MTDYEELKRLKGVGAATAKALSAAGFTSLLKVASAERDQLAEVISSLKMPAPPLAEDLIEQAQDFIADAQPSAIAEGPDEQPFAIADEQPFAIAESPDEQKTSTGKAATPPRRKIVLARLLVEEIGEGLLKAPAIRSALLKRILAHPPTRARIIRNLVEDLG